MKKIILSSLLFLGFLFGTFGIIKSVDAASRVRGYYKPSTGRYVQPYYRTNPNSSRFDNYSTKGNFNPYTGKKGYVNPFRW